jgi:hypothetical protein
MRVLMLHPDDVPWKGEWSASRWDLIIDLGFAGASVYQDWALRTGARIISIHQFAGQTESYRWANQILEAGRGKFLDRMGLDWWEILAPWKYHELHGLYMVRLLHEELGSQASEIAATRAHPYVELLSIVMERPVPCIAQARSSARNFVSRISVAARTLRPSQVIEIAFDKWDPGFKLRSRMSKHRRAQVNEPVVLLPSAYSNVTRTQLAYAEHLPGRRFLLATTRRSGESNRLPRNVTSVPLAAYAFKSADTDRETADLRTAWSLLKTELSEMKELRQSLRGGFWNDVPVLLGSALPLRDAWLRMISSEQVETVLCADDLNYYTRLPLILAKQMGRRAIYCYHGALDGGLLFKKSYADLHLVKGEMERDYALQASEVEAGRIEIAAPGELNLDGNQRDSSGLKARDLAFFSQPYEIYGGRTDEIYREILQRLVSVAQRLECKVLLKLHPFESRRARERLVRSVLSPEKQAFVEVPSAQSADIVARSVCGIGLDSSVAVECTQRAIPYFLCGWLDFNGFGYMQQFARFGAGILLESPDEILTMPQRIEQFRPDASALQRLWKSVDDVRLDEIMFGAMQVPRAIKCAC